MSQQNLLSLEYYSNPQGLRLVKDNQVIEGFSVGNFYSDNGPGEQYIDICPDEYKLENGNCIKKCNNCNTEINDSDYTDICYPNNYDGIDNFGRIMCSESINSNGNTIKVSTQLSNINSKEELFTHHDINVVQNINHFTEKR